MKENGQDTGAVLALDIGGTTTRAARFEGARRVWRAECPTPAA